MENLSSSFDLIKKSFGIFFEKKNLLYFLKIYWPLSVFALYFVFQDTYISFLTKGVSLTNAASILEKVGWFPAISVVVGLAYLIFSFWISATGTRAMQEVMTKGKMNPKDSFKYSWKKLWGFSLVSILVGLITGAGFILLIIPGIIFLVWFHFAGFEYMTKDVKVGEALSGSKKLVKGNFWKVFGRIITFAIFAIIVQIILGSVPYGIGSVLFPLFGALINLPYFLLYMELSA